MNPQAYMLKKSTVVHEPTKRIEAALRRIGNRLLNTRSFTPDERTETFTQLNAIVDDLNKSHSHADLLARAILLKCQLQEKDL